MCLPCLQNLVPVEEPVIIEPGLIHYIPGRDTLINKVHHTKNGYLRTHEKISCRRFRYLNNILR